MQTFLIISVLFTLMGSLPAQALTLGSDLSYSTANSSFGVNASSDIGEKNNGDADKDAELSESHWSWSAGYNLTVASVTDSNNQTSKENTHEIDGGLGYELNPKWNFDFGLTIGSTPQENLTNAGPELAATFSFDPSDAIYLKAGSQQYRQTFTVAGISKKGQQRQVNFINEITKSYLKPGFRIKPFSFLKISGYYVGYNYNKNVNQFLSLLDSPVFSDKQSGGLSNTVSSFYLEEYYGELKFYIPLEMQLTFGEKASRSAADSTLSYLTSYKISRYITEVLYLGVGFEVSSYTPNDPTYLVSFSYDL